MQVVLSYLLERVACSPGTVFNAFAGVLHVLAEAMSGVAAQPDNRQRGGNEQQNHDASNSNHICYFQKDLAVTTPLSRARPQAVAPRSLALSRPHALCRARADGVGQIARV